MEFVYDEKSEHFGVSQVTYLGHMIDAGGLHSLSEKITAIQSAPALKNFTQFK